MNNNHSGHDTDRESKPLIYATMMRASPAVVRAETVCAIAAFGGSSGRDAVTCRMAWGVDAFAVHVGVVAAV